MLIYAAADIHGRLDRVHAIRAGVDLHRPDILVLAGDLWVWRRPEALSTLVSSLSIPILAVGGNSDGRRIETAAVRLAALTSLHLTRKTLDGIDFVGISGTLPLPMHSRLGWREAGLVAAAAALLPERGVLVVHPPPYGTLDKVLGRFHAGSRAVGRLIDQCSPGLVLCGHIHEQAGSAILDGTLVVNCAMGRGRQGALIRYDGRSMPDCRMLHQDG